MRGAEAHSDYLGPLRARLSQLRVRPFPRANRPFSLLPVSAQVTRSTLVEQ